MNVEHCERNYQKGIDAVQISEINLIDEIDRNYPEVVLEWLLRDRTTRKNIVWATNIYAELGAGYQEKDSIERRLITK